MSGNQANVFILCEHIKSQSYKMTRKKKEIITKELKSNIVNWPVAKHVEVDYEKILQE